MDTPTISPPVEGVYDVEKILRKYTNSKTKEVKYLVKWKHYSNRHNTWEPACNFSQALIDDYESKRLPSGAVKSKETKQTPDTTLNATSDLPSSSSSLTSNGSTVALKTKKPPKRPESKPEYKRALVRKSTVERRKKQLQLQLAIQQQQKSSRPGAERLVVFNPVSEPSTNANEEFAYQAELPKGPITVTDVTDHDLTVTISECQTSEGFFRL